MSGLQLGRPGSRLLRGPCLGHGFRPRSQLRFRLRFLRVPSLGSGCLGSPSLYSSSFSRPGFTIRNLLWTPANSVEGDKDRGILGFVYQTDTDVGGCQFKDPIGAMEGSGKFPSLALNIPGHVHKHSITNVVVFQSCSLIIMLLLFLLRLMIFCLASSQASEKLQTKFVLKSSMSTW